MNNITNIGGGFGRALFADLMQGKPTTARLRVEQPLLVPCAASPAVRTLPPFGAISIAAGTDRSGVEMGAVSDSATLGRTGGLLA